MQTRCRNPGAVRKKRIITGCVNRDRRQQRTAGSSGVFPVGMSWIYSSDNHVRTKIFMDDITTCPGNVRERVQHVWICQFKQMPGKHSSWEERKRIFGILQNNLIAVISAVQLGRGLLWPLWLAFHSQGIALHDYQLCSPRIPLCSPPTPRLGGSGCWVLLGAPTTPSPHKA